MQPLVLLFWGGLVLPGCTALVGPKEIRGFEGDTVSLQCTYGEELKMNKKYWCKEAGLLISRCSGTIFSGEYGQDGRVSVHDSPQELKFKVTLRNLTLKDTGKYWVSIPMIRILAPVLVLLALLLATGLAALGSYVLRQRREAQQDTKTQKKEKIHLSHQNQTASELDPQGAFEII
ncbi:CMRF35-like molecule 9 [Camelus dromedarius]|uniref:CMRF35-like molecule 9 n=1 Tax=Camelus dromedarius TaxID=9838 RepID=A0A5N4D2W5_CAMDR|nr:CMRF35-like molecule 9 [Camelus dromedarius]